MKFGQWVSRIFLVTALTVGTGASGHPGSLESEQYPVVSRYRIGFPPDETMERIGREFTVSERSAKGFEVLVPQPRAPELLRLVPGAELLEADIDAASRALERTWARSYHDLDQVREHLNEIVQRHPEIASLETYGTSQEGRPLHVLKLSDNVHLDEAEPEVLLTAATHGNELITVEVVFGIVDHLVDTYGLNFRTRRLLDSREIFIVPVVNPDGYARRSRYANGVDPNRDYPWPERPVRSSNPCVTALMEFFASRDIRGSLDFHSHGRLFMFPFAYTQRTPDSQDHRRFEEITAAMAATNGYRHGQISRILYPAPGSSADYYYWKHGTLALGVEIGHSHVPAPSEIPRHVKEHLESTLQFLEYVQ